MSSLLRFSSALIGGERGKIEKGKRKKGRKGKKGRSGHVTIGHVIMVRTICGSCDHCGHVIIW